MGHMLQLHNPVAGQCRYAADAWTKTHPFERKQTVKRKDWAEHGRELRATQGDPTSALQ